MQIRIGAADEAPLPLLLSADPSEQAVRAYLRRGTLFLGEQEGRVVAVAVLTVDGASAELNNLAVDPAHQGRGLGRRMLAHVLAHARATGCTRVEVGTGNSSLRQLEIYQRSGFRIIGVVRDYFAAYDPPIVENGLRCLDMIRLTADVTDAAVRDGNITD
ncbi:MAG: GNAT family N-acetyltransferase [Opitutus sp.]|nr:GNAT family N-acetyltransferase [Opitutus sp.]